MDNLPKLHIYAKYIPSWNFCGVFNLIVRTHIYFFALEFSKVPAVLRSRVTLAMAIMTRALMHTRIKNQSDLRNAVTLKCTFAIKHSNLCVRRTSCSRFLILIPDPMCVRGARTKSWWQPVGIITMALACGSSLRMRAAFVKEDTPPLCHHPDHVRLLSPESENWSFVFFFFFFFCLLPQQQHSSRSAASPSPSFRGSSKPRSHQVDPISAETLSRELTQRMEFTGGGDRGHSGRSLILPAAHRREESGTNGNAVPRRAHRRCSKRG